MAVPATGGGGSGGGGSGGSGGGGGDGGDDGEPEPEKKKNFFSWKGWEERVAADPNFVYKVFIEQVWSLNLGSRPGAMPVGGRIVPRFPWPIGRLEVITPGCRMRACASLLEVTVWGFASAVCLES